MKSLISICLPQNSGSSSSIHQYHTGSSYLQIHSFCYCTPPWSEHRTRIPHYTQPPFHSGRERWGEVWWPLLEHKTKKKQRILASVKSDDYSACRTGGWLKEGRKEGRKRAGLCVFWVSDLTDWVTLLLLLLFVCYPYLPKENLWSIFGPIFQRWVTVKLVSIHGWYLHRSSSSLSLGYQYHHHQSGERARRSNIEDSNRFPEQERGDLSDTALFETRRTKVMTNIA